MKALALGLFLFVVSLFFAARMVGVHEVLWALMGPQLLLVLGGSVTFLLISQAVETE